MVLEASHHVVSLFQHDIRASCAFIVTWGTLGVLAPEVALIVAQEEHDLNPALQRHLPLDDVIRLGENPDFQWILHFNSWTIKL